MTDQTAVEALLPCPFCGGEAVIKLGRGGDKFASCWEDECPNDLALRPDLWNTRAAMPPPNHTGQTVEAVAKALSTKCHEPNGVLLDMARAAIAAMPPRDVSVEVIDAAVWALLEYGDPQTQTAREYPDCDWKIGREWTLSVARKQTAKAIDAALRALTGETP